MYKTSIPLSGRGASVKTTRLSVVSVTVAAAIAAATLSGRGARVYTCTCVHDNIPCRRLPT